MPFLVVQKLLRILFLLGFVAHGKKLPLSIRESNTSPVFLKRLFNCFYDKFSANFFNVIILFQL